MEAAHNSTSLYGLEMLFAKVGFKIVA